MGLFSKKQEIIVESETTEQLRSQLNDALGELQRQTDSPCINGGNIQFARKPGTKGALSISTVFSCVELISNSIAMMDINVKTKDGNNKIEAIPLRNIFYHNKLSKFNLVKNMISDMILYGNGYAKIIKATDGSITGLKYLPAQQVTTTYIQTEGIVTYLFEGKYIEEDDIIHIYKNTFDGYVGVGLLAYARRGVNLANAAEDSTLDFYSSGLSMNFLAHAKSPMTQRQAEQAVKSMQGTLISSGGYMKFVPYDMEIEALSIDPEKAALIQTRQFNVQDLARYFTIPVSLLTDNNQNAEQVLLQFLTICLAPYLSIFEDELNRKLISDNDLYFDFDERAVIRVDMRSTAEYLKTLVDSAIISVNEARDLLGLPLKPDGDALLRPYSDTEQNLVSK